jgi:rod shape-determining protein MreD
VLGEYALVLSWATCITAREQQKIRSKPPFQESLIILVILTFYEVALFAIHGLGLDPR